MPSANRYRLPGNIWHITHRCHRLEFLLKFALDRRGWRAWLFKAHKRFNLCALDFIVTSNHIHLLVLDRGQEEIPKSMQLIAGRAAQAYNQRKGRSKREKGGDATLFLVREFRQRGVSDRLLAPPNKRRFQPAFRVKITGDILLFKLKQRVAFPFPPMIYSIIFSVF
jgi:REP element-mobilizing transposase RayT